MPYLKAMRIGREADCDVKLTDASVSRIHAEVHLLEDGDLYVTDCDSSRGTFVEVEGQPPSRIRQQRVTRGATLLLGTCRVATLDLIRFMEQSTRQPGATTSHPPIVSGDDIIRCAHCSAVKKIDAPCPTCGQRTRISS